MSLRERLRRLLQVAEPRRAPTQTSSPTEFFFSFLNISSLFTWLTLLVAMLGLCCLDIFLRVIADIRSLIVVGCGAAVLVTGTLITLSSRKLSNTAAVNDIPKKYMPINTSDVPQPVYRMIQSGLSFSATVSSNIHPNRNDIRHIGWGRTPLENVHFRSAMIETIDILEHAAADVSSRWRRDKQTPVRMYVENLTKMGALDETLGKTYCDMLEDAQYGNDQPSEEEYMVFMKQFALLLRSLGAPPSSITS
ncbi:hypothetical protein SmJEL517_g01133 [Synchytrium microbalum]|uniref:Defect at low temperature protein 1 n=1 Tax=Synchytrium microbalum TaxID=1806994 RepID=A0A507CF54_9FUNG|nr:uncharacterized protein SmJEL517_g01133 [Synchytrium microbalum]TPX36626.1 hypothetical protein SmJEL517_g01133 [Synchytrium microbalum]